MTSDIVLQACATVYVICLGGCIYLMGRLVGFSEARKIYERKEHHHG